MTYKYCPDGHRLIYSGDNSLFSPYYYCEKCDICYVTKLEKLNIKDLDSFSEPERRMQEMKNFAKFLAAKKKITPNDLKKLGYL